MIGGFDRQLAGSAVVAGLVMVAVMTTLGVRNCVRNRQLQDEMLGNLFRGSLEELSREREHNQRELDARIAEARENASITRRIEQEKLQYVLSPRIHSRQGNDLLSSPSDRRSPRSWNVHRVIDGDTLEVDRLWDGRLTVRLLNVDTPERGERGYGEAKQALAALVDYKMLEFEFETAAGPTFDRYGRLLAFAFLSHYDTFVNLELVEQGWSDFYTDYGRGRYDFAFEWAERKAGEARVGLHE